MLENSYNRERGDVLHDVTEEVHGAGEKPCAAEEEEQEITSEWLKATTAICGWLTFFLVMIVAGALFSAIYDLGTYNPTATGYEVGTMMMESLAYVALAIYTVYLFVHRRPNAVFFGKVYLVFVFLSNLLALIMRLFLGDTEVGIYPTPRLLWSIILAVVWFLYLSFSAEVAIIIPKSFRKVYKRDWGIVIAAICLPLLIAFIAGFQQAWQELVDDGVPSEEQTIDTSTLSANERSDGRIIVTIPEGFACAQEDVLADDGASSTVFSLSADEHGTVTIFSAYDDDTSEGNFDDFWEQCQDDRIAPFFVGDIQHGTLSLKGNLCRYRIAYYDINGMDIYQRLYIIYNTPSKKVCVVLCFDDGTAIDYVDALLASIRF